MAQVVSLRPLTAEAQVSPRGICGEQSGNLIDIYWSFLVFTVNIIPLWLSILIYHMEDEQYARWGPQFRDTVSSHGHEKQEN
jgi:hypothetical protein